MTISFQENDVVPSDPVRKIVCHGCYEVLDAADSYCRHCGVPTANVAGLPACGVAAARFAARPAFDSSDQQPTASESPWVVLPMLFLVLGPLALPLLWRSRRFTVLWKSVLTVVMLAVTAFLLWDVWFVLHQSLAPLRELEKLKGL